MTTTRTTVVTLRLDRHGETIRGTLADERGTERTFWGWLELSEALDELRGAEGGSTNTARTPTRGSEE